MERLQIGLKRKHLECKEMANAQPLALKKTSIELFNGSWTGSWSPFSESPRAPGRYISWEVKTDSLPTSIVSTKSRMSSNRLKLVSFLESYCDYRTIPDRTLRTVLSHDMQTLSWALIQSALSHAGRKEDMWVKDHTWRRFHVQDLDKYHWLLVLSLLERMPVHYQDQVVGHVQRVLLDSSTGPLQVAVSWTRDMPLSNFNVSLTMLVLQDIAQSDLILEPNFLGLEPCLTRPSPLDRFLYPSHLTLIPE